MKNCGSRIASCGFSAVAVAGLALVLALPGGCAKRRSTMAPPPRMDPGMAVETNPELRADELSEQSRRFADTAEQLPGRSDDEHRRLVQRAFAELGQVLATLYGANPPGTFRQQLRAVEGARTQLAAAPRGLAPEPTIDTGLRAARDALAGLAGRGYADPEKLAPAMDRLDKALSSLDAERGSMHQSAVAQVTGAMADVIRVMSEALAQRLAEPRAEPQESAPAPESPADAPVPPRPAAPRPGGAQ